jgi:hypothetical protein
MMLMYRILCFWYAMEYYVQSAEVLYDAYVQDSLFLVWPGILCAVCGSFI